MTQNTRFIEGQAVSYRKFFWVRNVGYCCPFEWKTWKIGYLRHPTLYLMGYLHLKYRTFVATEIWSRIRTNTTVAQWGPVCTSTYREFLNENSYFISLQNFLAWVQNFNHLRNVILGPRPFFRTRRSPNFHISPQEHLRDFVYSLKESQCPCLYSTCESTYTQKCSENELWQKNGFRSRRGIQISSYHLEWFEIV